MAVTVEEIIEIIRANIETGDVELTGETPIREIPDVDSLDVMMAVNGIEDAYGITIEETVLINIHTIEDMTRHINTAKGLV